MVTRNASGEATQGTGANGHAERAKSRQRSAGASWTALERAWRAFGKRIPEMRSDLNCYAAVQADRARLAGAQVVGRVILAVFLLTATGGVFCIGTSLVIGGIAGGLASALHGNVWLANLITGAAALLLLGAVIAICVRAERNRRLRRLQRRYERHEARHRAMPAAAEASRHAERS